MAKDERRKAVEESTKAARESSERTLKEQSNMKPVPSQEEADLIVSGAVDPLERESDDQPEGPAADAEAEVAAGNKAVTATGGASYQTREASKK